MNKVFRFIRREGRVRSCLLLGVCLGIRVEVIVDLCVGVIVS